MLRKVCDYIKQNKMLDKGDRIVVGVSGGADSVCLLHMLYGLLPEYGAELFVVHINHGIRGSEADRDEEFVRELCNKLNIKYHRFFCDVKNIAREENLTIEEAGRKVRYQAFFEICKQNKCNKIAIAHNRNDNAETVLFHLFRGSGLKGLSGIDPVCVRKTDFGDITVIRPLLCMDRREIEEYLKEGEIPYRTDMSNFTEDYSRNKIRNRVLAYVSREINPNAAGHIDEAALQIRQAQEYIDQCTQERFSKLVTGDGNQYSVSCEALRREDIIIRKGIVRKLMESLAGNLKDLEAKHVEEVLALMDKQVGRQIHLPYGMTAQRGYQDITFYYPDRSKEEKAAPEGNDFNPVCLVIPGKTYLPGLGAYLETEILKYKKNSVIPKNSCIKWFDYDKIENAVVVRTGNTGDYMQINSAGGTKKLKDYFIDRKVPRKERTRCLLITDGSHVMWILGDENRISEKYKVRETTENILLIKLFLKDTSMLCWFGGKR